jgi:hypothetical protein
MPANANLSNNYPDIAGGLITFTGSTTVAHGLGAGVQKSIVATLVGGTAAIANNAPTITLVDNADGTFSIYGWKFTSTANPTLIAATSAVTVSWFAIGA